MVVTYTWPPQTHGYHVHKVIMCTWPPHTQSSQTHMAATYTWLPCTHDCHEHVVSSVTLDNQVTGLLHRHSTRTTTTLRSGRRAATAPHSTQHDTDETHTSRSTPNQCQTRHETPKFINLLGAMAQGWGARAAVTVDARQCCRPPWGTTLNYGIIKTS